jgi:hypothetical protein
MVSEHDLAQRGEKLKVQATEYLAANDLCPMDPKRVDDFVEALHCAFGVELPEDTKKDLTQVCNDVRDKVVELCPLTGCSSKSHLLKAIGLVEEIDGVLPDQEGLATVSVRSCCTAMDLVCSTNDKLSQGIDIQALGNEIRDLKTQVLVLDSENTAADAKHEHKKLLQTTYTYVKQQYTEHSTTLCNNHKTGLDTLKSQVDAFATGTATGDSWKANLDATSVMEQVSEAGEPLLSSDIDHCVRTVKAYKKKLAACEKIFQKHSASFESKAYKDAEIAGWCVIQEGRYLGSVTDTENLASPVLMAEQLNGLIAETSKMEVPTSELQPALWEEVKRLLKKAETDIAASEDGPKRRRKEKKSPKADIFDREASGGEASDGDEPPSKKAKADEPPAICPTCEIPYGTRFCTHTQSSSSTKK